MGLIHYKWGKDRNLKTAPSTALIILGGYALASIFLRDVNETSARRLLKDQLQQITLRSCCFTVIFWYFPITEFYPASITRYSLRLSAQPPIQGGRTSEGCSCNQTSCLFTLHRALYRTFLLLLPIKVPSINTDNVLSPSPNRQTDRLPETWTDRSPDSWTDREIARYTDRQRDRQINR